MPILHSPHKAKMLSNLHICPEEAAIDAATAHAKAVGAKEKNDPMSEILRSEVRPVLKKRRKPSNR
jgi:hypothetical protein